MPASRRRPLKPTDETVLHPTKGLRKISVKRSRASLIVEAVRKGAPFNPALNRELLNAP